MKAILNINNQEEVVNCDPGLKLVYLLRNDFQLCSAKLGCMTGKCGSCMILLDNKPVPACIIPVAAARGCTIITLEGFADTEIYTDISSALKQLNISLCGFCDASKYFAAFSIIEKSPRPTKEFVYSQIQTLECSCIDTEQFITVILLAAALQRKRKK